MNDCRVQNASVRLSSGDLLRFGYAGSIYQLTINEYASPLMVRFTLFKIDHYLLN